MKPLSIFHYCLLWYLPLPLNYITPSLPCTSVITSTPPDPKCFDKIFCLDYDTSCPDTSASPQTCDCVFILRSILSLYLSISPLLSVTFDFNLCFYQPRWLWAYSRIAHPYVCIHINANTNMLQTLSLSSQPPFMITPSNFQTLSVSHSVLIFLPVDLQAPQMAFSDWYNKKINRILLLLVFCMTKLFCCTFLKLWGRTLSASILIQLRRKKGTVLISVHLSSGGLAGPIAHHAGMWEEQNPEGRIPACNGWPQSRHSWKPLGNADQTDARRSPPGQGQNSSPLWKRAGATLLRWTLPKRLNHTLLLMTY